MQIFNGTVTAPIFVKLNNAIINPNCISEIIQSKSDKDKTEIYFNADDYTIIDMPITEVMKALIKAGCRYQHD